MDNNEIRIVIAGFGGQGVLLAGSVMARACVKEDRNVTQMVSYGAEVRGGTANSAVIISSDEIASPVIEIPDIAVILNQPSLDRFENLIAANGLVVLNRSLVTGKVQRSDLEVVEINATEIAHDLGNVRVANIVALGTLIRKRNLLGFETIAEAIEELFSEKKPQLIEINKQALRLGWESCESQRDKSKVTNTSG